MASAVSSSRMLVRSFTTSTSTTGPRIRAISMDVTGTMVAFSGTLEHHYADACRWCGVELCPFIVAEIPTSFAQAYKETSLQHPCFGSTTMSAKDWWRECVLRSFELSGAILSREQGERVFQRVYSVFGSHATYRAFPDAKPFLKWAHRKGIVCGITSNADERYGDSILPMLGLAEDLSFMCFSKEVGVEKPDPRIFEAARQAAEPWLRTRHGILDEGTPWLLPSEILHIGNDYEKDYLGAREAGFHAILLDRFQDVVAEEWRDKGVPVFSDLIDVVEYAAKQGFRGPMDP